MLEVYDVDTMKIEPIAMRPTDAAMNSPEPIWPAFIALATASLGEAKKAHIYLDADAVIARLEQKLAAVRAR